jgi:hypothetical protein
LSEFEEWIFLTEALQINLGLVNFDSCFYASKDGLKGISENCEKNIAASAGPATH